jgi:hypothetical protein
MLRFAVPPSADRGVAHRRLERAPCPADAPCCSPDDRGHRDGGLLVHAASMSGRPVDLRVHDRDRDAVVTTFIPALPCRRRLLGE